MPASKVKRIKKAEITRVALVPRGANRLPALYKEDGSVELHPLSKFDSEKGELLTLVYLPDRIDGQGHFASAETIQGFAHSHMRNGATLDLRHGENALTKEQAYVAESFIVQKNDERFSGWKDDEGNPVDATGGWGQLIKIDDPEIRKKYGQEGWEGVSLFAPAGKAELEDVSDQIVERFRKAKEEDMNKEEVQALLKEQIPAIVSAVAEALKPKETPPIKKEEPKDDAPVLKAEDRMNPEKVREYQKALKIHALQKETVWTDQKSIDNYLAKIAELNKEQKPKEESEEVKELRTKLEKALSASSQPDSNDDGKDKNALSKEAAWCARTGMTPKDYALVKEAEKSVEVFNKQRSVPQLGK